MTEEALEARDFPTVLGELEKDAEQGDIVATLVATGWTSAHAARYVSSVAIARKLGTLGGKASGGATLPSQDAGSLTPAYRDFAWGAALLAIGIGATAFTYRMANSPGGDGRWYLVYGPAVIGALLVARGFFRLWV